MSIALRKLMLRRRVDLFRRNEAFQILWDQLFPKHDLETLALKPPTKQGGDYWDSPQWREAAREYHDHRNRDPRAVRRTA